jgi:hypothetical protein
MSLWYVVHLNTNLDLVSYLKDTKIRFRLQVESYISDWQFSKWRHIASYVSCHNAMAYDRAGGTLLVARLPGRTAPDQPPGTHDPRQHKIRDAAWDLPSGRVGGGASRMHAEDIKRWLHGIMLEEDPDNGPNNVGEGENWRLLVG